VVAEGNAPGLREVPAFPPYDAPVRLLSVLLAALLLQLPPAPSGPAPEPAPTAAPQDTRVTSVLFAKIDPAQVRVEGARTVVLSAKGGALRVDGTTVRQPFLLPEGTWKLTPRAGDHRELRAALSAWAEAGAVVLVATWRLEDYVAEAIASETVPWTPPAAMRAQAIVTRSWVLAAGKRHARAQVCDHAHCQVLLRQGVAEHRPRSRAAAEATVGRVLRLPDGSVALAVFHAACGGSTEDPALVFGSGRQRSRRPHPTGAVSIVDRDCPARAWHVLVPRQDFERHLARVLGLGAEEQVALEDVELVRGPGGRVVGVRHRSSGRFGSGDALARGLDRPSGWGNVWSARFDVHRDGDVVAIEGRGYGHGVGLCQTGAAARARRGEAEAAILLAYFPDARIVPTAD
jgi:stage II sporulation protein D